MSSYAFNTKHACALTATQEGLITTVERMCLLDVVVESKDPKATMRAITVDSPEVQSRVAEAMAEFARYHAREGIFTKAFVRANAKTMPPAQ
eukprot:6214108-Pleurochrysis_carterae.AAC.2